MKKAGLVLEKKLEMDTDAGRLVGKAAQLSNNADD
jgi:hypothetical protein